MASGPHLEDWSREESSKVAFVMVGSWKLEVKSWKEVGTFSELHHVVIVLVTTGHAVNQMTFFTMMMRW